MPDQPIDDPLFEFDDNLRPANGSPAQAKFDEQAYCEAFPDIARSVRLGELESAHEHYLKHGIKESRLADPRYLRALRRGAAPLVPEPAVFPTFGVDTVFAARGGLCLVIGWIDDRDAPLREIVFSVRGRTAAATTHIARCRRADAEGAIGVAAGHLLGFWTVLRLPPGTRVPERCVIELFAGGATGSIAADPKPMTDAQLRDTIFEYFAAAAYLGNPQVESFVQLTHGPGEELLRFNAAMSAEITARAYVERYGPQRAAFDGSIVVCLYGKPEFLFLQSALFAAGAGIGAYEFIYVCNSPELTEILQREARIAEQIYGLSLTLVLLPGNAGFGAANNVAAQQARSNRLLIVNPDVFPREAGWAQAHTALVAGLPSAQTSLFGVPLFYDDGSLMHGGMHFEIDTGVSVRADGISPQRLVRVEHYGKGAPPDTQALLRARPVPAVTGAFMSADRAWFEKLGGFSEEYVFGHYEDADLCLKSLEAGRPAWLQNLPFWHLEGKGSDRRAAHEGGSLINRWHFTRRWGGRIETDLSGPSPAFFAAGRGG